MLHIHLTLLTFLLGSLSSFTWGYIVELWKLKKGIFSLDLSELPGGLFGRSNYINNKQINININLNSHHKNSKRDWKRSNKENLLGKKRLEMFLLIHFYSSPTIFLCCNQHFFLHLQLQIYAVKMRYMANTCKDLSYVIGYQVRQRFRLYVENMARVREDQNHTQIT